MAIQKADTQGYPWRNQVALPGGHVDDSDVAAVDAAYRELEEELGIGRDHIDFIGSMGHFQTINSKDIEVFVGVWDGSGPLQRDPVEVSRVLEIPLAAIVGHHLYHGDPDEPVYPFRDVQIWGATARILHYFFELTHPCLGRYLVNR